MKLSMMSYTMSRQPQYFDLRGMLELTRELGLDGIDFVRLHDTDPRELRRMADDYGVPVVCHTFFAPLHAPTSDGLRDAVDSARQSLEAAVVLGAPAAMVPTAGRADEDRDEARKRWIAGLSALAPYADDAGVVLTVENFPGAYSPFVTADDFLEARRAIPGLRLTFDNGNVAGGEDPVASFRRCAADIVHAHFKDWSIRDTEAEGYRRMLDGRFFRPALIGEGDIDQRACLSAMRAAGYDGCINIEYEGNEYRPDDAVRKAVSYLRDLWASLDDLPPA